ncbi:uncharacterized protein LOC130902212 [Diorhabda carinulata]|uniref:uncharacterized protein LOC130902212 n=1 Tax=Diorhabda carinulata TaxID=1163345 RepID=UPI0025A1BD9B|nr:uncharacterized protein LOC130902212 [Diorhabda carinulata]
MIIFVAIWSLVAVATARPEAGYSYSAPSGPSASGGGYPSGPSPQYGPPQTAPVVQKHVYVHVPPPETDIPAPRKPITVAPPQKHYKIIFIKAPTPPTPTAPIIPAQPQNEEKTLVYVLVKKPEPEPEIVIPTPAPTQPSKPEVYFIRYKTQKEEGGYPASGTPDTSYGAPSAGPSSEYGAPRTF